MRKTGKITSWDPAEGTGLIMPIPQSTEVVVCAKALHPRLRPPPVGTEVCFTDAPDSQGRPRAVKVWLARSLRRFKFSISGPYVASTFLLAIVFLSLFESLSVFVPAAYLAMSLVMYANLAADKVAMIRGGKRASENALYILALAGGWPGALFSPQYRFHKSRKAAFRKRFLAAIAINLVALLYHFSVQGAWLLALLAGKH